MIISAIEFEIGTLFPTGARFPNAGEPNQVRVIHALFDARLIDVRLFTRILGIIAASERFLRRYSKEHGGEIEIPNKNHRIAQR